VTDLNAVVRGAGELVVGPAEGWIGALAAGDDHPDALIDRYADGAVAISGGRVAAVGSTADVCREFPPENAEAVVDAAGRAVVPGFVDPHTHALFAGDRSDEFAAKLRGKTYQEILAEGGGILRTVSAVREASDETLVENLRSQLDAMLAAGTTTVEVKSGYGLETETELRMLDAVARADERHPIDVVSTFMGAHAVPRGVDADEYVSSVVEEQLPAVERQGTAKFCDVFCEEGVFSVAQSRRVLDAGVERGLTPKVHAEELSHLGGSQLAADVGAASADHLLHADSADAEALAAAGVTPVLLPGTAFGLGAGYADPETFVAAGAPPALATDLNPNCYSQSMGFAQTLACVGMGMSPAAALLGATVRAADAISLSDGTGTLRTGAPGDVVVVDGPTHVHLPYQFDGNAVAEVLKGGEVVTG
jgi:imidazolonepropionase